MIFSDERWEAAAAAREEQKLALAQEKAASKQERKEKVAEPATSHEGQRWDSQRNRWVKA